jgi:hypothetical protein
MASDPSTLTKVRRPESLATAHGASDDDAFHLVIPSLPGHGFSGKPTTGSVASRRRKPRPQPGSVGGQPAVGPTLGFRVHLRRVMRVLCSA